MFLPRTKQIFGWGRRVSHHATARSYKEAERALFDIEPENYVPGKTYKKPQIRLRETLKFAQRLGVSPSDMDKLCVIHMTGTKGKGSTGAFCQSILRHHGYKTGFLNSPHLLEARERIQINGIPLSKDAFSNYFWDCLDRFKDARENENDMPARTSFLFLMACHVFLKEKVEAAVIEVGCGGRFDPSNIIRSPVVCGVSNIDVDHVKILGDTLQEIAWQKAGLFKPDVPALTVLQSEKARDTLLECAKETRSPLFVTSDIKSYGWGEHQMELGIPGDIQKVNASLALAICDIWLKDHAKSIEDRKLQYRSLIQPEHHLIPARHFHITERMHNGLKNCQLAGRSQMIRREGLTYYLDVAHTPQSIQLCLEWFQTEANIEQKTIGGKVLRMLLFYPPKGREINKFISSLKAGRFDCVAFCPSIATAFDGMTEKSRIEQCESLKQIWTTSDRSSDTPTDTRKHAECDINTDTECDTKSNTTSCTPRELDECAFSFESLQDALVWVAQGRDSHLPQVSRENIPIHLQDAEHIQVLCTGSVRLVAEIMKLSPPN